MRFLSLVLALLVSMAVSAFDMSDVERIAYGGIIKSGILDKRERVIFAECIKFNSNENRECLELEIYEYDSDWRQAHLITKATAIDPKKLRKHGVELANEDINDKYKACYMVGTGFGVGVFIIGMFSMPGVTVSFSDSIGPTVGEDDYRFYNYIKPVGLMVMAVPTTITGFVLDVVKSPVVLLAHALSKGYSHLSGDKFSKYLKFVLNSNKAGVVKRKSNANYQHFEEALEYSN